MSELAVRPIHGLALCAGAGGLELGLHLALGPAYRTVGYVEVEAYAAAHLVARMESGELDAAPLWSDIRTFDPEPWRGKVHLVSAGFPCQDISAAGKRAGIVEGERSALWFDVARIFRDCGAEWLFVENVDDLIVRGLDVVLWTLAEMGADAAWGVLGAHALGAPHRRDRTWLLARRRPDEPRGVFHAAGAGLEGWREGLSGPGRGDVGHAERPFGRADLRRGDDERDGPQAGWRETDGPSVGAGRHVGAETVADPASRHRAGPIERPEGREVAGRDGASVLADADDDGQPLQRRQPEHDRHARGDADGRSRPSGDVDDPDHGRQQPADDEICSGRDRPEHASGPVRESRVADRGTDAGDVRVRSSVDDHQPAPAVPVVRPPHERRGHLPVSGLGVALGNAESVGRGEGRAESAGVQGRPAAALAGGGADHFPYGTVGFPPDRGALDLWADVLAEAPELEPGLCRVAARMAERVDRLRLTGNGVVPIVAAVAFCILAQRLGDERLLGAIWRCLMEGAS